MSETADIAGSCLCGSVRFVARRASNEYSVCHCKMCRKISGPGFMSVHCDEVDVLDDTFLETYDSSAWATRSFCSKCGTPLFYRVKNGDGVGVAIGTLEASEAFTFKRQYFLDHKPKHFAFANATDVVNSADIYAAYPELRSGGDHV